MKFLHFKTKPCINVMFEEFSLVVAIVFDKPCFPCLVSAGFHLVSGPVLVIGPFSYHWALCHRPHPVKSLQCRTTASCLYQWILPRTFPYLPNFGSFFNNIFGHVFCNKCSCDALASVNYNHSKLTPSPRVIVLPFGSALQTLQA